MQAINFGLKGNANLKIQHRGVRVLLESGRIRNTRITVYMAGNRNDSYFGLKFGSGVELGRVGNVFRSSAKVVNGALEYLAKDLGIVDNPVIQGWVVSTLLAGATVGSFTGGSLADYFGRTKTFLLDAIPLTVGAFLCATARNVQTMILGRLLAGIGIGISSATVPLYISEIAPTEIRGTLGSINQLFICIGILAALVTGLPLARNPRWWRAMFGIAAIPSILLALGMTLSPESPHWLVQQRRTSQAEKSIQTLYGDDKITDIMANLSASSQGYEEPDASWFDLFSARYFKVVSVGAALFLFQQLAGINALVYYPTFVFHSAGVASDVAASALVGAANVFG